MYNLIKGVYAVLRSKYDALSLELMEMIVGI